MFPRDPQLIYYKARQLVFTKCDSVFYYKVAQTFYFKVQQLFYYKVRQLAFTKGDSLFYYQVGHPAISECDSYFITKCGRYYKVQRLLQMWQNTPLVPFLCTSRVCYHPEWIPNPRIISRKNKIYFPPNIVFKRNLKAYYNVRRLILLF